MPVAFVNIPSNFMGEVYRAQGLSEAAGSTDSSVLQCGEGQLDITVQLYGTLGGATITVQGSLAGTQFTTLDDAYGQQMSYTALTPCKPVGPAVTALKIVVTGGTGVNMTADVYMLPKRW